MKYLVEEESLIAIADTMRDIDIPHNVKLTFPNGFIDGINQCYTHGENIGYNKGMSDGYDDGWNMGYQLGEMDGYDFGYTDGKQAEYNRLVDEEKLLPTTIQANTILRVDDISEIPLEGSIKFNSVREFYVCGKNLINPQEYFNDSNATTLEDDVFTTTFTNAAVFVNIGYSTKHQKHPKGTYTLTFVPVSTGAAVSAYVYSASDRSLITSKGLVSTSPTLTFTADEEFFVAIGGLSGNYGIHSYKLQLEVGSATTGYEKYKGYKSRVWQSDMEWFCPITTIYTVYPNQPFTFNYYRSYGQQTAYDAFWDGLQKNGNRTTYACAFGGWNDDLFKPKYDICPTDGYMMFRSSEIQDLRNITDKDGNPIKLDFSKVANTQYMFQWAHIRYIGEMDIRAVSAISSTVQLFGYTTSLISIDKLILKDDGTQKIHNSAFDNATALQSITIEGIIPTDLSFQHSKKLNRASIESIVNALSTTATGQTITFSKTAINKAFETTEGANDGMVSAEFEALIASRENWTFAFST